MKYLRKIFENNNPNIQDIKNACDSLIDDGYEFKMKEHKKFPYTGTDVWVLSFDKTYDNIHAENIVTSNENTNECIDRLTNLKYKIAWFEFSTERSIFKIRIGIED